MNSVKFVLLISYLFGSTFGAVEIIQDGNFILEYNLLTNDTEIQVIHVKATVRALGWVGVGLSETNDMTLADMIMGGVNNGTGYIGDYFAFGNTRPVEDIEYNILSWSAAENSTHTVLEFTRLSDTGDEFEDVPLDRATHIIWAYNSESDNLSYHGGVDRGNVPLNSAKVSN